MVPAQGTTEDTAIVMESADEDEIEIEILLELPPALLLDTAREDVAQVD